MSKSTELNVVMVVVAILIWAGANVGPGAAVLAGIVGLGLYSSWKKRGTELTSQGTARFAKKQDLEKAGLRLEDQ